MIYVFWCNGCHSHSNGLICVHRDCPSSPLFAGRVDRANRTVVSNAKDSGHVAPADLDAVTGAMVEITGLVSSHVTGGPLAM